MMASTAFLKESGSSESCSFQATYRQPHFFGAQQETGDSFHAHGFRPPTDIIYTHAQTHTQSLVAFMKRKACCHLQPLLSQAKCFL